MRRILTVLFLILGLPAFAADVFVAPSGATLTCKADGSEACPWPSLAALFKAKVLKGGDTVVLKDGRHEGVRMFVSFDPPLTITAQNDKAASVSFLDFGIGASGYTVRNLGVWRNEGEGAGFLVRSLGRSTGLTFDGLDVRSRENATNLLSWSAERWAEVAGDGFDIRATGYTIRNSTVAGVKTGILAMGAGAVVENNRVDGFLMDGLKSGGGDSVFRENLVQNRFKIDGSHADGFQAYKPGTLVGLVIDGNRFFEWTHAKDHPLRGSLQGIGMFDGPYQDVTITNNLIATRHWNGITVAGPINARIVNNTVANIDGVTGAAPWIRIASSKKGVPPRDVLVANNLASSYQGKTTPAQGIVVRDNGVAQGSGGFRDLAALDFDLAVGSPWIGKGDASIAPEFDLRGTRRGATVDMGALQSGCR